MLSSRILGISAAALVAAAVCAITYGQSPAMDHSTMHHEDAADASSPKLPGQDAFGAMQEIVAMLEADPATDWNKADLDGLREHLIDMNEVTLHARAKETRIPGGLEMLVTGEGRTAEAISRMIPANARAIDGLHGWHSEAASVPDGVRWRVTSSEPAQVAHIRGLGFAGILVSGSHHQPHHLMMARGTFHH
jgi:hypothetical protein